MNYVWGLHLLFPSGVALALAMGMLLVMALVLPPMESNNTTPTKGA